MSLAGNELWIAFFSLFIVMDALGNVPIFLSLTQKLSPALRKKSSDMAVIVAGGILLAFLYLGQQILAFFGISISSFQIAGGIILGVLGIKLVLGIRLMEQRIEKYQLAIVPLSTPLITGPGVITVTIMLVQQYGTMITLTAALLNLGITWIVLHNAEYVHRILGRQGSDVLSRIMGLLLAGIAVEFVRLGIGG